MTYELMDANLLLHFNVLLNLYLNYDFEVPDKLFVLALNPGENIIKWALTDENNIDPTVGELKIIAE